MVRLSSLGEGITSTVDEERNLDRNIEEADDGLESLETNLQESRRLIHKKKKTGAKRKRNTMTLDVVYSRNS